jgi:hypothetical protein
MCFLLPVFDLDFPVFVSAETFSAALLNFGRRPVNELMHSLEVHGKIDAALRIGDQDFRTKRIHLSSDDADRNRVINLISIKDPMRDEGFLLHYPQTAIDSRGALAALSKYDHLLMRVVGKLDNFEKTPVVHSGPGIVKNAVIHSFFFGVQRLYAAPYAFGSFLRTQPTPSNT